MHWPLKDDYRDELEGRVREALGDEWAARLSKVMRDALDSAKDDLLGYIEYQLSSDLGARIAEAAQRSAEDFLERLASGDDEAVRKFIGDPPGYRDWQRKKDEWTWLPFGQEHGPVALRKRMVDFAGDALKDERIKDLEAEVAVLRDVVARQKSELEQWRTGERIWTP